MVTVLIAAALAQEADIEIEVWGEGAVRLARSAVVRDLAALGWRDRPRRDGEIVFLPPHRWVGRAHFDDEGTLWFGRKLAAVDRAVGQQHGDLREDFVSLTDQPSVPAVGPRMWILPSRRKTEQVTDAAVAASRESVSWYREVLARTRAHGASAIVE